MENLGQGPASSQVLSTQPYPSHPSHQVTKGIRVSAQRPASSEELPEAPLLQASLYVLYLSLSPLLFSPLFSPPL